MATDTLFHNAGYEDIVEHNGWKVKIDAGFTDGGFVITLGHIRRVGETESYISFGSILSFEFVTSYTREDIQARLGKNLPNRLGEKRFTALVDTIHASLPTIARDLIVRIPGSEECHHPEHQLLSDNN